MWAATLITSGAAVFGRLFLVNFLPSTLVVLGIFLPAQAGSFGLHLGDEDPAELFTLGTNVNTPGLLLLLAASVIVAALTQTFQIAMIRLLEGYWGSRGLFMRLANRRSEHFRERALRLYERYASAEKNRSELEALDRDLDRETERKQSLPQQAKKRQELERELRLAVTAEEERRDFPPDINKTLPTRLGNIMRSFEMRAGERYGYSTLQFWPRLYPFLGDQLSKAYHASVDAVDAGVNFFYAFCIVALCLFVAYVDDPILLWVPLLAVGAAMLAKRGAVAAARMQGLMEFVSFDLHRFEVLTAMHIGLPQDPREEKKLAEALSNFLRLGDDPGSFASNFPDSEFDHDPKTDAMTERGLRSPWVTE